MPDKDFKTLFNELLHNYGMGLSKLAEITAIPERYLEAMRAGNETALPPEPYVRGYLVKIIALTGGNLDEIMAAYKREGIKKTSGPADRLPSNRFSLHKISKGKVFLAIVILLLIVYSIIRFNIILGNPKLILNIPEESQVYTTISTILLKGEINPGDKLTINGENIVIESNGSFATTWPLTQGVNNLEIRAKRFLGKEEVVTRRVIYTPIENVTSTSSASPIPLPL
ncbi:MAG: helix-turn-helix domain-containing protein [bacterium]|nr:helix-turn-helix domain-containing protein [bacterium]